MVSSKQPEEPHCLVDAVLSLYVVTLLLHESLYVFVLFFLCYIICIFIEF